MKKNIVLLSVTVAVVAVALWMYADRTSIKNPVLDLRPRGGNANGSAEYLNAQKAVQYYRDEIRRTPDVVKNYVELAQIFLQESRVTANHHEYVPKAQYLLREALSRDPNNFEALVTNASLSMTLHRFAEARELAQKGLSINPYNASCYNTLVDALVELGEYDQAVMACDKLMSIHPDLRGYARVSYLRELHGDLDGAIDAMKMAADAGMPGQEQRAWTLYNLANLFLHEGKLDTAEFIYRGILEERPHYAYALSGLAQVRMAQRRHDEAIQLFNEALETTPEHIFMEELSDLYQSVGQDDNAGKIAKLVLQSFEQHNKDGWNTDREYALFCASHNIDLPEALQRARKEYDRRPKNIDALQTYAWLLYKNGHAGDAISYIEDAMRLNTKNALLEYRAGLIHKAADRPREAAKHLQEALTIDPFISGLYADDARRTLESMNALAVNN